VTEDPDGEALTRLRPAYDGEQALLEAWREDPQSPFEDWSGPAAPGTEDADRLVPHPGGGRLVVADGMDDPLGTVSWHPVLHGPTAGSVAWDIGISLRPFAQGLGHGARAQRMLVTYLFATTPAHRVQASTDVLNLSEQRALERAGFGREGVARGAQWRGGRWHDLVLYARLRGDA
jgi:RimJ/RimL family protein N-acetyltransferase